MSRTSAGLTPISAARVKSALAPHRLALVVMWLAATIGVTVMLLGGVRSTGAHEAVRYVLQVGYALALLWYIIRTGPRTSQLPEIQPQVLPGWKYGAWLPVLGTALVFALTVLSDDGLDILILLLVVATFWLLLAWRRDIRLRAVVQGLALALVAYFAGRLPVDAGLVGPRFLYLLAGLSLPMYVAGGLLFQRTRLGGSRLHDARYGEALKGLLRGGLLFVPLGLLNAASGSPGPDVTWVTRWWMPLWIPWFSAVAEEVWFRLFLVGLVFFLLRPALRARPALAAVAAVIFSGIAFGLGHGRRLERLLTTGLLYGVPMAAIFARRSWEHAVGAHYVVNVIPWTMVFLETL